jgi:hypothetical protein
MKTEGKYESIKERTREKSKSKSIGKSQYRGRTDTLHHSHPADEWPEEQALHPIQKHTQTRRRQAAEAWITHAREIPTTPTSNPNRKNPPAKKRRLLYAPTTHTRKSTLTPPENTNPKRMDTCIGEVTHGGVPGNSIGCITHQYTLTQVCVPRG